MSKISERVITILQNARQVIKESWGKAALYDDGEYCAIGAVNKAANKQRDNLVEVYPEPNPKGTARERAMYFLANAITGRTGAYNPEEYRGDYLESEDVYSFNDAPTTKKRDVLRAFDRAIKAATTGKLATKPLKVAVAK